MDFPERYGADGMPIEEETRRKWDERDEYVRNIAGVEKSLDYDDTLSSILASRYYQNFSSCLTHYENGKQGWYCKNLDESPSDRSSQQAEG